MPFTPLHFGPAILLGLLLWKKLDFPTFIAANVVIDWRAALVFLGFWPSPRHSWVHSYLGAVLMAVLLGVTMIYLRPRTEKYLNKIGFAQEFSVKNILTAAFSGTFLHVAIDAVHHPSMHPFMPFNFKPLYGLATTIEMRALCFTALVLSIPVYWFYVRKNEDRPQNH